MAPSLSLPTKARELGQYGDCNWDDAVFVVYTLLGNKVPVQNGASALENEWMEHGNEDHVARPAVPTAEFETLEEILKAHIALDKGKRERDDGAAADLE
jgi:hypothetical protein